MTDSTDDPEDPGRPGFSKEEAAEAGDLGAGRSRLRGFSYGPSLPVKLPSGHRRYADTEIARLRLVSELVARGLDPQELMDQALDDLELQVAQADHHARASAEMAELNIERAIQLIESYDADGLLDELLEVGCSRPACEFVEQHLGPLLVEIGQRCSTGALEVGHEYLATSTVESLLRQLKARMQSSAASRHVRTPATVVLACLSGERHVLPLHMVAYVAELAGARTIVMGGDASPASVARAASMAQADIVGVHCSQPDRAGETERHLRELRGILPEAVQLLVGGTGVHGVARIPAGAARLENLSDLETLIADLVNQ